MSYTAMAAQGQSEYRLWL